VLYKITQKQKTTSP